jgi:hypothetical protein
LLPAFLVLYLTLGAVGCSGSKEDNKDGEKKDDPNDRAPPTRLTMDNIGRIQSGMMSYTDVQQLLGGPGEPTNEDRAELMPGNKYLWKDGSKKVFVSFDVTSGKANGMAWEGFGGK